MSGIILVAGVATTYVLMSQGTRGPGPNSDYGNPALDAIVALPEQLYSPPNPLETSQQAAKRVEPLVTHDLFLAMSAARERVNYKDKMRVVAQQHGTVRAQASIDDHDVRHGNDTPTSVSRTVTVIQQISIPNKPTVEDKFSVIVDVTPVNGVWKAKLFAPAPLLDELNIKTPPVSPPPAEPTQPKTCGTNEYLQDGTCMPIPR